MLLSFNVKYIAKRKLFMTHNSTLCLKKFILFYLIGIKLPLITGYLYFINKKNPSLNYTCHVCMCTVTIYISTCICDVMHLIIWWRICSEVPLISYLKNTKQLVIIISTRWVDNWHVRSSLNERVIITLLFYMEITVLLSKRKINK